MSFSVQYTHLPTTMLSRQNRGHSWIGLLLLAVLETCALAADGDSVKVLQTPGGIRFGIRGDKKQTPAPTLLVCAQTIQGTLASEDYNKIGRLLAREGFLSVALDLPCHGKDERAGEPAGLNGWAARLAKDEDLVADFTKKASAVLDYLIAEGYTDPKQVATAGTSRGGFIALHFGAANPRVRCVVAFAPVTDLLALREFAGMEKNDKTNALSLGRQAERLAGRPIWLCIGNNDQRVDTDRAIAFTRRVVQASAAAKKPPLVELHVMTSAGHTIHPTAHDEAAAWLAKQFRPPPDKGSKP